MKKSLFFSVFALFFIFAGLAHAGGFRDLSWGANLSNMRGMKQIGTDFSYGGGIDLYVRPKDVLKLGEAKLEIIVYKFWKNKLFGVTIRVANFENYKALRDVIKKKFGNGLRHNPFIESYMWLDPPTRMHLEYNEMVGKGRLAMYSSALVKQAEAFDQKKTEEAPTSAF